MSFYNMINGCNAGYMALISCIVGYRIDKVFPRFRDIFSSAEDSPYEGDYFVYTRMGGGNRDCWEYSGCDEIIGFENLCPACQADAIEEWDECVGSYDDDFDCTYRTFCMKFTDEQRAFYDAVTNQEPEAIEKVEKIYNEMFKSS